MATDDFFRARLESMIDLRHPLKHAFDLSDQALVARFAENVVWQFFAGLEYYHSRAFFAP